MLGVCLLTLFDIRVNQLFPYKMGEHFLYCGNYSGAFHLHVLGTEKVEHP